MIEPFAFYLLVGVTAAVVLVGFAKRTGYLQFPMLFAIVYLGWVIPGLWRVRQGTSILETDHLATLHLFSLACLIAVLFGWRWGTASGARPVPAVAPPPSYSELVGVTTIITLIAWAMTIGIGMRDLEERNVSNWSGPLTILHFFSTLKIISLFMSAYLALRFRSLVAWVLLLANIALYAPAIFIYFRRRAMVELLTCALLALWFARRVVVPRLLVLAPLPLGMLVVFGIGALRAIARGDGTEEWRRPSLSEIMAIDFWAHTPFAKAQAAPELTNALSIVRLSDESGFHTWGAATWNRLVFQWVPGQIVGADLKAMLMFDLGIAQRLHEAYYYTRPSGSTSTGMAEAYLEFGFVGVVFFAATAWVMGRWWAKADRGHARAAALYAVGMAPALIMPTSYASYFFNMMLLYGGALLACLYIVRMSLLGPDGHWQGLQHPALGSLPPPPGGYRAPHPPPRRPDPDVG